MRVGGKRHWGFQVAQHKAHARERGVNVKGVCPCVFGCCVSTFLCLCHSLKAQKAAGHDGHGPASGVFILLVLYYSS